MANIQYTEEFAFYQQLKFYYDSNRGKIRSRYNDLTKKFLAYNDKSENPDAFLRLPQFEALDDELHKNFNMDIKNMKTNKALTQEQIAKSFHADTYCFDSKPEKECFLQYITNSKIKEVYFTGMFTANQGDLSVQYYDPESGRIRHYYPDFLAKLEDGSYQLIEVKGDNKIDDTVVKAKAAAAQEMAVASGIEYKMYAGSEIMTTHILAYLDGMASTISYADHMQQGTLSMVAETSAPYGSDK